MRGHGSADLVVEDLTVEVAVGSRSHNAVTGVDLAVAPGEIVALIGESGSGKTLTLKSILRMLPNNARVTRGAVRWRGEDVLAMSAQELRRLRRSTLGYVPADSTSLNPVYRIGAQLAESLAGVDTPLRGWARHRQRICDALREVGLGQGTAGAEDVARLYPDALSGGMRQRALIAMAVQRDGALLVADEPTSGLDITTQRRVMDVLVSLCREREMALLVASHDLALVGDIADRVVVMYGGQVVEDGSRATVFSGASHPYTHALLHCVPTVGGDDVGLEVIRGAPPTLDEVVEGCRFRQRCDHHEELDRPSPCFDSQVSQMVEGDHTVRCAFPLRRNGYGS